MATVWAKSNGNWTTASIWAFWNETTQQIEDYGQVPQVDDDVFLNGYTIQSAGTINIGAGTISNGTNPYTSRSGGRISSSLQNFEITANLEGVGGYIFYVMQSEISSFIINGDINGYGITLNAGPAYTINITGNVSGNFLQSRYAANITKTVNIVGNINEGTQIQTNTDSFIINVTGNVYENLICSNLSRISRLKVDGYLYVKGNNIITYPLTINGVIDTTQSTVNYFPITSTITFSAPSTIKQTEIDYPRPEDVKINVVYADGQMVGTYDINQYLPPESVVLKDYEYGDNDDRKTGTMVQEVNVEVGCVTPEDVREGVALIGMGVVGSLVVPTVDDVREGVVFDNGSVGTLIVQGGGDRLRIADFGYYTRSTSITYIVDLTESDKPAFADCEEIVLRSLFPTLDLDNIPDKFFDDLFIQFLRYRLLVEYYRGTSINSKFTPSEPTAEIVNYANTKCEYWLNTANLFLQLWGEKYPNSVKKDRILL